MTHLPCLELYFTSHILKEALVAEIIIPLHTSQSSIEYSLYSEGNPSFKDKMYYRVEAKEAKMRLQQSVVDKRDHLFCMTSPFFVFPHKVCLLNVAEGFHCWLWWSVTKYIYTSAVLKYKFEVLVLEYLHFMLPYTCTPQPDNVLFTALHVFETSVTSYFAYSDH